MVRDIDVGLAPRRPDVGAGRMVDQPRERTGEMRTIRILGLCLVAVLTIGVVASPAAWAKPEFLEKNGKELIKKKFTFSGGEGKMYIGSRPIKCKKEEGSGEVVTKEENKKVAKVKITFKECSMENASKETCKPKSKGGTEGKIETNELKGELGEVANTEAESEVGLKFEPASGKVYVTLEGKCLPSSPAPIEGSLICEVKPVGTLAKEGKLVCAMASEKQKIRQFKGETAIHELEGFGLESIPVESTSITKFEEEVKV
jgi:hypothetical protein